MIFIKQKYKINLNEKHQAVNIENQGFKSTKKKKKLGKLINLSGYFFLFIKYNDILSTVQNFP